MKKYSDWLAQHYAHAQQVTAGTGIFPEILLSQAIIESAKAGKMPNTNLSVKYKNYFGIKAGANYKGKTAELQTGEFSPAGEYYKEAAKFRAYDSVLDSFADYVRVLKHKRYNKARAAGSITEQAEEIKKAGYSTAPDYATTIAALAQSIKNAGATLVTAAGKAAAASPAGAGTAALAVAAAAAAAFYLFTKRK